MFSLLASKCSSKDTQEILTNFSRVLRLGFGGKLAKVFASQNKTDVQNESIKSSVHKDELDKLISRLFMDVFVNMSFTSEDLHSFHKFDCLNPAKTPLTETLFPASQWLLLPVDVQFQVILSTSR